MLVRRDFHHRLMLIGIKWFTHSLDPLNTVLFEDLIKLALGRLNAGNKPLKLFILAQFSRY